MGLAARKLRMTPPAAGGGGVIAEDTFTRSDSTTLGSTEVGAFAWSEFSGNTEIKSNAINAVFAFGSDIKAGFNCGVSDLTLTANITTSTTANRTVIQPMFRYQDTSNYWIAEVLDVSANHTLQLSKIIGGSQTVVGTPYSAGFGPSESHEIVVVTSGSSIEVFLDGVSRIAATDSALSTATVVGVRWYCDVGSDNGTSTCTDITIT